MPYFREEIPLKLLSEYKLNSSVENVLIEINVRPKKWLLSYSFSPNFTLLKIASEISAEV